MHISGLVTAIGGFCAVFGVWDACNYGSSLATLKKPAVKIAVGLATLGLGYALKFAGC